MDNSVPVGGMGNLKDSVTSIAMQMGYENASKFSAAFKSVIGTTPADYRKSIV